jgi:manganese efflux pump family protein
VQQLPFLEILLISLGLSADAFSVALAAGAHGFTSRRIFRLSWHFGLFQFLMPLIGWYGGEVLAEHIGGFGKFIVLLLLVAIGCKMIYDGFKPNSPDSPDLSRGWKLVILSVCTSLDALAVGFGLGLIGTSIIVPALIIGIVCAAMTTLGLFVGVWIYKRLGHKAMILGGLILIGIGIKMVV